MLLMKHIDKNQSCPLAARTTHVHHLIRKVDDAACRGSLRARRVIDSDRLEAVLILIEQPPAHDVAVASGLQLQADGCVCCLGWCLVPLWR